MLDHGRPTSVEPFVRGIAWPAGNGAAYPRADPADAGRLPNDTWGAATLPVGVRLEIAGDAVAVEIAYSTATEQLGYRGVGVGTTFTAWRAGACIDEQPAVLGDGIVRIRLRPTEAERSGDTAERTIVYLPEGMRPLVTALTGSGGTITPPARQPRWLAYGDSIAEGWIASGPAGSWPAIAGRAFGLDTINLGYAGSARGEIASAQQIAMLVDIDVISISHGTNCWTRIPHSVAQMQANSSAFLRIVRDGHPGVPIVVASPIVRPDGEAVANVLGATHAGIRAAMEHAVRSQIDSGDSLLTLVPGANVVDAALLADGVHPGDDGHKVLADVFGCAVAAALSSRPG